MKYIKILVVFVLLLVSFPINVFGDASAIMFGGTSYSSIRAQTEKVDFSGAPNKLVWSIRVNRVNNEPVNFSSRVFLNDGTVTTSYNDVFELDNSLVRLVDRPDISTSSDSSYQLLTSTDGTNYTEELPMDWRQVKGFKVVLPSSVPIGTTLEVGFSIEIDALNLPTDLATKGIEHSYIYGSSGGRSGDWMPLYISPKIDEGKDVIVEYVDEDDFEISTSQALSGNIGDPYDATTDEYKLVIPGYTLDESQLPSNATGLFSEEEQKVRYVYKKDINSAEDVTVKYQDEEGRKLAEDEVKSGNIGDPYTTEQKEIEGYTFKEVQGSATGTLSDQAQTVTYIYSKIPVPAEDVTVKYQDEEGRKLAEDEVKSGNIGDPYTTEQKEIEGYTFKEVQGSATGTLSDQAQTVTYIYSKIPVPAEDVTVKYQDEEGRKLAEDEVKSGNIGDPYTTEQKEIEGYTFKEVQGSATGTLSDQAQTVTYIYSKIPVPAEDVTVKYQDEEGRKLAEDEVKSGNIGDPYTTEQKEIEGYTFKEVQGSATGTLSDQAQTVTYIYSKIPVPAEDVTVKYQDEEGRKLAEDEVKSGNIGDPYTTEQKEIEGYTFKEVQGSATGTLSDQAQTVTYIYSKIPVPAEDVTVKYQDEEGRKLAEDEVKSGNIGDPYTTEQKEIEGYTFKEVQGSATGTLSDQAQTVTYIYSKIPVPAEDVTVKYQDEEGRKLAEDEVKSGNIGDPYTTEQKEIEGYTFKEVQGSATGTLSDQAQTVTYIYSKIPVPAEDVTVKYQDEEGRKLAEDEVKSGNIGDPYTTEQKEIEGYTFKEVQGSATGTLSDQAQTVVFVYTRNDSSGVKDTQKNSDKGEVVIRHTDMNGKSLGEDEIIIGNVGRTYTTKPLSFLPSTGMDNTTSEMLKILGVIILICIAAFWRVLCTNKKRG
ncbi:MucBP domain-containing protein [Enterococcus sp. DIV0170]|uniref:MucBP domain-containing protein n=1 Tax=Enterococcus sp. DIV0170 TaxID=2774642 RepID=UPI003F26AFBC